MTINHYRLLRRDVAAELHRESTKETSFKCLCCMDRGYLSPWIVRTYIPGYGNYQSYDPPVICNRCDVAEGYHPDGSPKVPALEYCDRQISAEDCEQIHQLEVRRMRSQTVRHHPAQVRHAVESAQVGKSMPAASTTQEGLAQINQLLQDPILRQGKADWVNANFYVVARDDRGLPLQVALFPNQNQPEDAA